MPCSVTTSGAFLFLATFATTLACVRRDVPPFHYMIALVGGDSIRCAPYAQFGTQALSDLALEALQDLEGEPAHVRVGRVQEAGHGLRGGARLNVTGYEILGDRYRLQGGELQLLDPR
mgnify:CR=1 FL=1